MQDKDRDTMLAEPRFGASDGRAEAVSFTEKMLASENFMVLFREGMSLVEATAAYLDGEGRADSRALDRPVALAYASESMRLTTRLMQLTSWLLLQRAVNEGELSRDDAEREHRRVTISPPDSTTSPEVYAELPAKLRALIDRSLGLYGRIQKIDQNLKSAAAEPAASNPVANQLGMLAAAFRGR
jgi:regulator of CtrA degradation